MDIVKDLGDERKFNMIQSLKSQRKVYINELRTCSIEHVGILAAMIEQTTVQIKIFQKLEKEIAELKAIIRR